MNFSDKFLKSIKPQDKKYDIREKTGRGLAVTVFPSGAISLQFIYHYKGRKRRMTLGKYPWLSIKKAKEMHQEALRLLELGKDPALIKRYRIIDSSAHKRVIEIS